MENLSFFKKKIETKGKPQQFRKKKMETTIWEKGNESGKVISINGLRFWLYNTTLFFRSSILL